MKAALYEKTGPARDVLTVAETERPEPGPGEVRVRVHASGVNPTDVKARSGAVPRPIDGFQIPHQDGAGVIDKVGEGVDPRAALGHGRRMDRGSGRPGRPAAQPGQHGTRRDDGGACPHRPSLRVR
jgi:NADPH:quinone reductase-like Zn-dependent oxidoreductase